MSTQVGKQVQTEIRRLVKVIVKVPPHSSSSHSGPFSAVKTSEHRRLESPLLGLVRGATCPFLWIGSLRLGDRTCARVDYQSPPLRYPT